LHDRRGTIKAFLLDQDRIAGIGNVYVQTPLWQAKIHPLRPIPTLTDGEVAALWQALREVLQGSTPVPAAEPVVMYRSEVGEGRRRRRAL
jgi:formamidopyrimidine-DNA glycosylase